MALKLTVIAAGCGAGKSFATVQEAIARVQRGQKVAITTPSHKIAREYEAKLHFSGVPTLYRFAPHRLKELAADDQDPPYCSFVDPAELLAGGGLSVKRELCEGASVHGFRNQKKVDPKNPLRVIDSGGSPCPYLADCPAASGERRLPDDGTQPMVWIGPHMLLHEALEFVGYGLLVIDEPPQPISVSIISSSDLNSARYAATLLAGKVLPLFIDAIEAGVRKNAPGNMGRILSAGLEETDLGKEVARDPDGLRTMVGLALLGLDDGSEPLVEKLQAAIAKALRGGRPRLVAPALPEVRGARVKRTLARGAQTIAVLTRAILETGEHAPKSGIVDGKLVVVEESHHLRQALMRSVRGLPTVLLDATIDAQLLKAFMGGFVQEEIEALRGEINFVEADVEDAVPIERRWLYCASANRRSWIPKGDGKLDLSHFIGPFRRAIEIAAEDPSRRRLGIIAYKPIVALIAAAWKAGGDPSGLSETAHAIWEALAPWRSRSGATLQTLHFGDLRGSNDMQEVDGLITLGDPWSDRTSAQLTAAVLSLRFEELYRAGARAELEQAVGRFRAVCRSTGGVIVVVGSIPPRGWTTEDTMIEELVIGRPKTGAIGVRGDVLRAWRLELGLSEREAARLFGIGQSTLRRHERDGCAETAYRDRSPSLLSEAVSAHLSMEADLAPGRVRDLPAELKAAPFAGVCRDPHEGGGTYGELVAAGEVPLGDPGSMGLRPSILRRALGIGRRAVPLPAEAIVELRGSCCA